MNKEIEIWKDVSDYKGVYQVSNLGNVKSLKFGKERLLKPQPDKAGYLMLSLYIDGVVMIKKAHQLVVMAFLGYDPCGHRLVIDHINGDKSDNRVANLRIVTHSQNVQTCFRNKKEGCSSRFIGVSWNKPMCKWISFIRVNHKNKNLGYFLTEQEASNAYQLALSKL